MLGDSCYVCAFVFCSQFLASQVPHHNPGLIQSPRLLQTVIAVVARDSDGLGEVGSCSHKRRVGRALGFGKSMKPCLHGCSPPGSQPSDLFCALPGALRALYSHAFSPPLTLHPGARLPGSPILALEPVPAASAHS